MNSTLEYSALAANQVVLEQAEFQLREMLDALIDEFSVQAKQKGLRLSGQFRRKAP